MLAREKSQRSNFFLECPASPFLCTLKEELASCNMFLSNLCSQEEKKWMIIWVDTLVGIWPAWVDTFVGIWPACYKTRRFYAYLNVLNNPPGRVWLRGNPRMSGDSPLFGTRAWVVALLTPTVVCTPLQLLCLLLHNSPEQTNFDKF